MHSKHPLLDGLRLLLILSLIPLLSACGKSAHLKASGMNAKDAALSGPLGEELKKIQASPFAEACDHHQDAIKKKLLQALATTSPDGETPEPPSPNAPHPEKPELIPFQGGNLIRLPKRKVTKKGWISTHVEWEQVEEWYSKLGDKKPEGTWSELNSEVRNLLLEDKRRVVYRMNAGFDHENIAYLEEIGRAVDECMKVETCVKPDLSPAASLAAKSIPFYREYLVIIENRSETDGKRKILKEFQDRLKEDREFRFSRINPSLSRKTEGGKTVFTLPLDPGPMNEKEKEIFKSVSEDAWRNETASVKLEWKQRSEDPSLFQVLFDLKNPGERAFVSQSEKVLMLFPETNTLAIAHEFGHVLGFDDHYYTRWDPENCRYITESNQEDIMSKHVYGSVTEEEWKFLLTPVASPSK